MKVTLLMLFAFFSQLTSGQSYNPLWIPDTISGTVFNLEIKDTTKQFFAGTPTPTMGINGNWWGPTLFFNKGDTVQLNVTNNLMDTTTIHWHGIHLPAMMDGGPHQPILPMTTWSPYFKVMNNAATYWYHPHLHMMTEQQVNMGLGGLIIVRDSLESTLNLPRNYGVDDIPLILTDRRFDNVTHEIVMSHYGDTMTANGTLNPEVNVPAQVVRFRILNAAAERSYFFKFSPNHNIYIITSDGGLLDAPVLKSNYLLSPGERIEILVNFTGQQGQSFDLKAFNGAMPHDISGSQPGTGSFANALGGKTFNLLHVNVVAQTANPITTIPASLTSNTFWPEASADVTRHITFTDPATCPPGYEGCSLFDSTLFDINVINKVVYLNHTEIWELENNSARAHPFHIHDVQFYILDYKGTPAPAWEQGWKDVVLVRGVSTARFIAKFEDYADSTKPFMYHCHILNHEDYGMMGQFVVVDSTQGVPAPEISYTVIDTVICQYDCIQFVASSVYPVDQWDWKFPGAIPDSSNLQNPIVCYPQTGLHDVTLTASNAGGKDSIRSQAQIKVNVCSGINEQVSDAIITLFPNPSGETINVNYKGSRPYNLYIYNVDGKIVLHEKVNTAAIKLNLLNLHPGIYFLKTISDDGVAVSRIQKY